MSTSSWRSTGGHGGGYVTGQGSWSVSIPFHVQKAERIEGEPVALFHGINVSDLPEDATDS